MSQKSKLKQKKQGKVKFLLTLLKGSKRFFLFSILAAFCTTLAQTVIPRIVAVTVDSIIDSKPPEYPELVSWLGGVAYLRDNLHIVALLLAGVGIFMALFRFLSSLSNAKGAETLSRGMKDSLYAKIHRLPLKWHSENHTGDIIQRATSDTETVRAFVSDQLTQLFNIFVLIAVSLVMVFTISPTMAWITLGTIPLVISYSTFFYFKCGDRFLAMDENEGKLSAIAQENIAGSRVVKAFGREDHERVKFEKQNQKYTLQWMRFCRVLTAYWGIGDLVSAAQIMIVLVLGTLQCVGGAITLGNLLSFITYNTMLIWPVRSLGRIISDMSKAGVAIDRIRYILDAEEEQDPGTQPFLPGDIVFEHVSFSYGEHRVLQDVSFTLPQGKVLGILGGTGSGKSTLLLLLTKLYTPTSGRITVGGVDIQDMNTASLREHIATVMQEPFLFSGTLAENIHAAADTPDLEAIREAAAVACLTEAIEGFSDGYQTVVGEKGVTLSGGQKQRTAIARMLMAKAPVMVLDDSLSAVDTETDAKIRAALKEKFSGATVLLVSHRINTLMQADVILVLENGRVSGIADHRTLLEQNELYRRIYDIQMSVSNTEGGVGA